MRNQRNFKREDLKNQSKCFPMKKTYLNSEGKLEKSLTQNFSKPYKGILVNKNKESGLEKYFQIKNKNC